MTSINPMPTPALPPTTAYAIRDELTAMRRQYYGWRVDHSFSWSKTTPA